MSRTIAQRELGHDHARIIDAVEAGETFLVTRDGVPVAEIRPVPPPRARFVARKVLRAAGERSAHIDAARFRADTDRTTDASR